MLVTLIVYTSRWNKFIKTEEVLRNNSPTVYIPWPCKNDVRIKNAKRCLGSACENLSKQSFSSFSKGSNHPNFEYFIRDSDKFWGFDGRKTHVHRWNSAKHPRNPCNRSESPCVWMRMQGPQSGVENFDVCCLWKFLRDLMWICAEILCRPLLSCGQS